MLWTTSSVMVLAVLWYIKTFKKTSSLPDPNASIFTFKKEISKTVSKSRIDYICVSSAFSVLEYLHEDTVLSDHDLIKTCITFNTAYE